MPDLLTPSQRILHNAFAKGPVERSEDPTPVASWLVNYGYLILLLQGFVMIGLAGVAS